MAAIRGKYWRNSLKRLPSRTECLRNIVLRKDSKGKLKIIVSVPKTYALTKLNVTVVRYLFYCS